MNEDKPPLREYFLIAVMVGFLMFLICCLIARAEEPREINYDYQFLEARQIPEK